MCWVEHEVVWNDLGVPFPHFFAQLTRSFQCTFVLERMIHFFEECIITSNILLKFFLPQMFKFFSLQIFVTKKRWELEEVFSFYCSFSFLCRTIVCSHSFGFQICSLFASEFNLKSWSSIGCDVWVTSSLTINLLLLLLRTKIFLFDADISCILVFPTFFKEDFFYFISKKISVEHRFPSDPCISQKPRLVT